jgi:hypothetical protein
VSLEHGDSVAARQSSCGNEEVMQLNLGTLALWLAAQLHVGRDRRYIYSCNVPYGDPAGVAGLAAGLITLTMYEMPNTRPITVT